MGFKSAHPRQILGYYCVSPNSTICCRLSPQIRSASRRLRTICEFS